MRVFSHGFQFPISYAFYIYGITPGEHDLDVSHIDPGRGSRTTVMIPRNAFPDHNGVSYLRLVQKGRWGIGKVAYLGTMLPAMMGIELG